MTTDTTTSAAAHTRLPILDELRSGPPTVSVERAAKLLGVSRGHAYFMARDGLLPVIKVGDKRVRVPVAGLLRLLEGEA